MIQNPERCRIVGALLDDIVKRSLQTMIITATRGR